MKTPFLLTVALLAIPILAGSAEAPAPTRILLENDYVRVSEVHSPPGEKRPMHSHPAHLIYAFTTSKARMKPQDGTSNVVRFKKGRVTWHEPVTHEVETLPGKEAHLLLVELKKEVGGKTPAGADPVKVNPKAFKVLFENDRVRVIDSNLKPGAATPMHAHPPSVVYALTSYEIEFTAADGARQVVHPEAGTARWLEPVLHSHRQLGTNPAHALLFELKK